MLHVPKPRWVVLLLLVVLAFPSEGAETVDATARTFLRVRPDWAAGDARTGFQAIEYVGLRARGIDSPLTDDVRVQLSAWGSLDSLSRGVAAGDVDLAHVEALVLSRQLSLTLGRQLVTGGAARVLQLDGLAARLQSGKYGLSLFGGVQSIPRFAAARGDATVGGRAFYRYSFETELGVSYFLLLDRGLVARSDAGLDLRYGVSSTVWLTLAGIFSALDARFSDADLALHWQATPDVELSVAGGRSAPDLYVPRSSIFSVFAEEQRDFVGVSAFWSATQRLSAFAEYLALFTDGGAGHDASARVTYRLARRSSLGLTARLLAIPESGYVEARAFVRHALSSAASLSAELDSVWLREAVNDARNALTARATGTYHLGGGFDAALSASVGQTPFYSARYELLARLGYTFDPGGRE